MSQQTKMAAEVARLRPLITALIGCPICASGIAIDAVGERYGYAPFEDWRCLKAECPVRKNGVAADKLPAVREIIAALPPAEVEETVAPAPSQTVDSRLPPEPDDERGAWAE